MPVTGKFTNTPSVLLFRMDSFENNDIKGMLFHRYEKNPGRILGAKSLVDGIERLIDGLNYPEATVRYREFVPSDENNDIFFKDRPLYTFQELTENEGGRCNFYIMIESRNHANWQGQIYYAEGDETVFFRSEVELIAYIVKRAMER